MVAGGLNPQALEFFPVPTSGQICTSSTNTNICFSSDLFLPNPPYYVLSHSHDLHYQQIFIPSHFSVPDLAPPLLPVAAPADGFRRRDEVGEDLKPVIRFRRSNRRYWRRKCDHRDGCFGRRRDGREWVGKQRLVPKQKDSDAFSAPASCSVLCRLDSDNDKAVLHSGHQKHCSVVPGELDDKERTTVMIRNIPNRYTREMLKAFLDQHCSAENQKQDHERESSQSAFDFLYLPIDFTTKSNKGYAFVNFTKPEAVRKFFLAANEKGWDHFRSPKIRELCYARLQGKGSLVVHFESMEFPCEEFQPVRFEPAREGSRKPVEEICVGRRNENVRLVGRRKQ